MPAPYSDNMYSGNDDFSDNEQDALSPTDGYFHASSTDAASPSHLPSHQQPEQPRQPQQHPPQHQHHRTSSQVPFVPNVLVEDPTLRQDNGAAKAREAEEERLRSQQESSTTDSNPSGFYHSEEHTSHHQLASPAAIPASLPTSPTHHHRRSVDEDISVFSPVQTDQTASPYSHAVPSVAAPLGQHRPGVEAPPAYSYSPTSPTSSSPEQGYQTFASVRSPNMGVPEEHQSLLPRLPESMGGPPTGSKPPLPQRFRNYWNSINFRSHIKTILGTLVIFSIIAALISGTTVSFGGDNRKPDFIHKEPIKTPDQSKGNEGMQWPSGNCRTAPQERSFLNYDLKFATDRRLEIIQTIERRDDNDYNGRSPNVFGEVRLRPLTDDSATGHVEFEILSNQKELVVQSHVNRNDQSFKVVTPRSYDDSWNSRDRPCIQIRATVWIPLESYLQELLLDLVHLDVKIDDGLILGVSSRSSIKTVVGDISTSFPAKNDRRILPYTLESREIVVESVSGDIKGWLPLYDLLKVTTASGDVSIDVGPKPADPKARKPARLEAASASGDFTINEPLDRALASATPDDVLPPRDYVVKIETASGNIKADLATSSTSYFDTKSGDITLRLLPVLDSKTSPRIHTQSTSGDTRLDVLEPLGSGKATIGRRAPEESQPTSDDPFIIINPDYRQIATPDLDVSDDETKVDAVSRSVGLSNLESAHNSISGDLFIHYPSSWSGSLTATTISGSQRISGEDLDLDTNKGWVSKTVKGRKGDGKSRLSIATTSGDQNILIGTKK